MKVLVIDPYHEGATGSLDFAMRAQQAGHKVKFYQRKTADTEFIGKGIVDRVNDFKPWLRWADLIFNVDNTKHLDDMERARAEGQAVFSANKEVASWELDRQRGMEVLRKHRISTPDYKLFTDYDSAILHTKSTLARYVSKPCGDADKHLSYCSKSPADMVYMLEKWRKSNRSKQPFILQEFKQGTEFAVGGFFGPNGFNVGFCENFEFKKLMNGDLGVNTGEMGTVLRFVSKSKLADKLLAPLIRTLEKEKYIGYIDVSCIIDDEGNVWPLEFTTRPGWPTFNIQQALIKGDPVEWLHDLCMGKDSKPFSPNEIAIGVCIVIPDFPYSHATQKEVVGIPIYGITPSLMKNIHPCAVMMEAAPVEVGKEIVKIPNLCAAGDYVMIVTATGMTVKEAREKVYRKIKRIEIPNSPMWRTDIGQRLSSQLLKLQKHGFAKGMRYSH
jgi:phosphoribosylamine--glycine ligase